MPRPIQNVPGGLPNSTPQSSNVAQWLAFGWLSSFFRVRRVVFLIVILLTSQSLVFSSRFSLRPSQAQASNHPSKWALTTGRYDSSQEPILPPKLPPIAISGRVVVTGGGGNIGKEIVRRLLNDSTPVTVLDKIFFEDELDDIFDDIPGAKALLQVHKGDIRNPESLQSIMTEDVVGVIHLAAVSRVLWCLQNEEDCWDVNERGTKLVLEALTNLNRRFPGKRWFVLASSREVYGDAPGLITEDMQKTPANVYGESKLRAEKVLENHMKEIQGDWSAGELHAIGLRLSNVYGGVFDHVERLIPAIITQAISHQVIQIVGGKQHFDLLHIDDCVDAFLLAAKHLSKITTRRRFFSRTSLEYFNVASGDSATVHELIDKVVRYTRSKSPIQYIPGDDRFPNEYRGSSEKISRHLGFQAKVTIDDGILRLTKLHLRASEKSLSRELEKRCSPKSEEHDIWQESLLKLHMCSAHITVSMHGESAVLQANHSTGFWTTIDDMPPPSVYPYLKRSIPPGKILIAIQAPAGDKWLGIKTPIPNTPRVAGRVVLVSRDEINDGTGLVDWEMYVNTEDGTIRLVLLDTDYQLLPPARLGGGLLLARTGDGEGEMDPAYPLRITPVCCPTETPWPFFADDPTEHALENQRTSLRRPFLASVPKTVCDRLHRARLRIRRELGALSLNVPLEPRRAESSLSANWANSGLPACSNVCGLHNFCVDTGDCQCVLSSCPALQRFPFQSYANLPTLSYPHTPDLGDHPPADCGRRLVDMVQRSSWRNVLRPAAARFIGTAPSWPKIHVGGLPESFRQWMDEVNAYSLRDQHCFSADSSMQHGIEALMNVSSSEADYTFIPHYQGRSWGDSYLFWIYDHNADNNPYLNSERVIVPLTHDWGQCFIFEWNVWDMRKARGASTNPYILTTTAWTVMADMNTPCYRPHQDIVIPPRTCLSEQLYTSFKDMTRVRPARERGVLVTFSGSGWGTGAMRRFKLVCSQRSWSLQLETLPGRKLLPDRPELKPIWSSLGDHGSYLELLNNTMFCPQPSGTTGWATRMADSIYAGCIPVLIGEASHYPFFDMIDWSKISVRIDSAEINDIEKILLTRYTIEDVEQLQTNLMLIRNAFVYPLDDLPPQTIKKQMIDERGPLFFALHATKMRMLTMWPMNSVYDRPD